MDAGDTTDTESDSSLKRKLQTYDSHSRRSVFNITLADTAPQSESVQCKDLENKLNEEINEWVRMWRASRKAVKASHSAKYTVDISLLPEDKRKYLESAPNLQMFIRNSLEFREKANVYLNFHRPKYLEMQQNFKEMYKYRTTVLKESAVKELLTNNTPNIHY